MQVTFLFLFSPSYLKLLLKRKNIICRKNSNQFHLLDIIDTSNYRQRNNSIDINTYTSLMVGTILTSFPELFLTFFLQILI